DHGLRLRRGLPDGLVHRDAAGALAALLALPDHDPVLDQPPDPNLRDQPAYPDRRAAEHHPPEARAHLDAAQPDLYRHGGLHRHDLRLPRSEERRVGKEWSSPCGPEHYEIDDDRPRRTVWRRVC